MRLDEKAGSKDRQPFYRRVLVCLAACGHRIGQIKGLDKSGNTSRFSYRLFWLARMPKVSFGSLVLKFV
jgi:hypothetical protein